MNTITRLIALPLLSAGVIGGAALGMAGTAGAAVTIDDKGGIIATPDVHAQQTMIYGRHNHNMYYWPTQGHAPSVDTTVHQSR